MRGKTVFTGALDEWNTTAGFRSAVERKGAVLNQVGGIPATKNRYANPCQNRICRGAARFDAATSACPFALAACPPD